MVKPFSPATKPADRAGIPGTHWPSILMVAFGAFCYSTLIIFTRWTQGLGPMSIAFFRAFFAFVFFCLLLIWFPQPLQFRKYRSSIKLLVIQGIGIGVTTALYIYAIQHTTAANAALLVNAVPIYIAIVGPWVLKEARPRYTWLSLGLIVIGIVAITNVAEMELSMDSLDGILAGVASGMTYTVTMLISRSLRGKVTSVTQTWWGSGVAALLLLPWVVRTPWADIQRNLIFLVPLGIVSLGISSLMYFLALQRVKAQVVSVVAILEPVSGVLIGLLLFNEVPTITALFGSLLILFSIYLITRS